MPLTTLDDWIARDAISFSLDAPAEFDAAVDRLVAQLGESVELLGIGEALHGGEEFLLLRNRLFARLAAAHGYSAIAIESSYTKGLAADDFVAGRSQATREQLAESGFGHGFGKLTANLELLEWMRDYNADSAHATKLRFYGFDILTSPTGNASPRRPIEFAVDYMAAIDSARGTEVRNIIAPLLGDDFSWENPAGYADPSVRIGLSPNAASLRLAVEDLIAELRRRSPELIAALGADRYDEALQHAVNGRDQLTYHAAFARGASLGELLGIRDALMADNLRYIARREQRHGKVLVFAHNAHLQRGLMSSWESWRKAMNAEPFSWWPAGSHIASEFGPRYAVIGAAVGASEANGISPAEPGSLEARLSVDSQPCHAVVTAPARNLPAAKIASLTPRSASTTNLSHIPLAPASLTDFDALVVVNNVTLNRKST